jgi:Fe-S-cluster containining protein
VTKKKAPAKKTHFKIVDMEHESFWDEKKKLPRFMFPKEYAIDPCAQCNGACCTSTVHLTMTEALRIHLSLTLPLESFTTQLPAVGDRGSRQSVPIPLDGGEVRLALRQQDGGDCVLLRRVGGRALCSAYSFRPGACRVFPYKVELDDRVVSAGPPLPCPVAWLWNEAVAVRVQRDVEQWLADLAVERALIEAWTAAEVPERTFAAFTRFAIGQVAAHLGFDAEKALAPARRRRLGESNGGAA